MKPTRYLKTFAALAALGLSLVTAHGQASIGHTSTTDMADQGGNNLADKAFRISVKPGNAKYVQSVQAGSGTGPLGDGTLLDWQVHTAVNGESPFAGSTLDTPPGTYFDTATCADSSVGGPQNYFDLWVANDIDSEAADFPDGTTPAVGNQPTPIGGNIDISGLEDGQIYVLNGTYRARVRVNLTMTGPGKTPIIMPEYQSDHDASTNRMRLMEFAFTNPDGEYTNIEWSSNNGQNNTGRRRWGGIFLDGTIYVDTVEPTWEAGYPNIGPVGSTLLAVNGQTDEATTIYYVVLADGASAPTSAQVKAGTDGSDAAAPFSGDFAVAGLEEGSELVTGLTASTAYDIYVVAEDVRGPNLQATPMMSDVTTSAPDSTPPNWSATYPQQSRTPASVTGIANIDEPGNAYFVVLASGATAPTSAQVKASTDASDVAAPSGTILGLSAGVDGSDLVGGLTVGATYDVWFVAEDLEGNLQGTPTLVTSTPEAAVDQFATGGQAWGTDSAWSSVTGGPYTNPWGDGNNAVFEGGSSLVVVDSGTTAGNMTFNSNNWLFQGGPLNLAGATTPTINTNGNLADFECALSGTQGLIKEGTGLMRFNSNNTTNTITGGWALNGGNLGDNSGNLGVNELNGNDITTNGASDVGITFRSGTFTSNFTLNAPFTRMSNNNSTVTITGAVAGPGGIEMNKTGDGTNNLHLDSTSNTFTGGVNMTGNRQCQLMVNSFVDSASLGAGNIRFSAGRADREHRFILNSGFSAPLTFNNRQFDIADTGEDDSNEAVVIQNQSDQPFTINTDLIVSGTDAKRLKLKGTGTGINTFAGAIPDGGSAVLSLIKEESSTWILAGTNTYTGGTSVSGGTLTISGSLADASMTISSGTVQGGSGTLTFNIDGTTTDQVVLSGGGIDISTMTANISGTPTEPEYVLVDATGGGTITGEFTALTGVATYELNYDTPGQVKLVAGNDYGTWLEGFPGADLSDPTADLDGDGVSNDDERLFGLDPTNPASRNAIAVPLDAGAGTLSYTRRDDALTGETYRVETSTDLVVWTRDAGASQTPGAPDLNDVETVAVVLSASLLDEDTLFVRVVAGPLPPIFSEDFESGDGGFTAVNNSTGTIWAYGAPNSPDQGGGAVIGGNGGSANAWGTNLTGGYVAGTDTSLRSDVIDLTGVAGAELSFALSLDALAGHTYQVDIIEAGTDTVIVNVIPATTDGDAGSAWKTVGPTAIPALALAQEVRIQWTFVGDGASDYNGAYLDDVTVTETN